MNQAAQHEFCCFSRPQIRFRIRFELIPSGTTGNDALCRAALADAFDSPESSVGRPVPPTGGSCSRVITSTRLVTLNNVAVREATPVGSTASQQCLGNQGEILVSQLGQCCTYLFQKFSLCLEEHRSCGMSVPQTLTALTVCGLFVMLNKPK